MENLQRNPVKIYIQDIFRANRTIQNKYVYEMFGLQFKNIMIHGVVTAVYNIIKTSLNFELSDATGTVQVYYDKTKNNNNIGAQTMKGLFFDFAEESKFGNSNIQIMNTMMDRIANKNKHEIKEGIYLLVIGDIFVDDTRNVRMVSAFQCNETSPERDVVWMEELMYLYDKYYLLSKNLVLESTSANKS